MPYSLSGQNVDNSDPMEFLTGQTIKGRAINPGLRDWSLTLTNPITTATDATFTIDFDSDNCPWKIMGFTFDISFLSAYVTPTEGGREAVQPLNGLKFSPDAKTATIVFDVTAAPTQVDVLLHRMSDARVLYQPAI